MEVFYQPKKWHEKNLGKVVRRSTFEVDRCRREIFGVRFMKKPIRDRKQKLECIRKAVLNAQEHIRAGDPRRVYSQYIRYALDEIRNEYFYVSTKAKGLSKNEIIQEHVVPHSIILDKLIALKSVTANKISDILDRYYAICEITKDENQKLDKEGLRSKMPKAWKDVGLDDRFARYDHVRIKYSKKGE